MSVNEMKYQSKTPVNRPILMHGRDCPSKNIYERFWEYIRKYMNFAGPSFILSPSVRVLEELCKMQRNLMENAFKMMCGRNMDMAMSEKCKLMAAPLENLRPMELKEAYTLTLQQGTNKEVCYEGRVVYGNIRASAKSGKRLGLCVVEADDGLNMLLHVFNAAKSSAKSGEVETMFPKGLRVAIKEPLCLGYGLHVATPAAVESVGIGTDDKYLSADELMDEGNDSLESGSYVLANEYYTECMKMGIAKDKKKFVAVISSRAEARLKLGRYEEAIMDAESALGVDPKHVESLHRKARGLCGIQEHERALECFESAIRVYSDSNAAPPQELKEDLEKCKIFLRQSQRGEYDMEQFLLSGLDEKLAPECSDYFGPVEVKMTPDGRGRGLFATKDLEPGELLIVCKPVAAVRGDDQEADADLFVEMVKACMACDRNLRQVDSLADAPVMNKLPDVDSFRTNVGKTVVLPRKSRAVDITRIKRVKDRVAFTLSQVGGASIPGLWGSVAILNHSCLPNVSKAGVGEVVFLRAAREIKAGEELVFSYSEPLAPWADHRKAISTRLGFDCICERCNLERAHNATFGDLPYVEYTTAKEEAICIYLAVAIEIEKRLQQTAGLTEKQKNWIRCGFVNLYCACMAPKNLATVDAGALPPHEEILRALRETAPGSTQTLATMICMYNHNPSSAGKQLLLEEVTAIYGKHKQEVGDAVIQKYNAS